MARRRTNLSFWVSQPQQNKWDNQAVAHTADKEVFTGCFI